MMGSNDRLTRSARMAIVNEIIQAAYDDPELLASLQAAYLASNDTDPTGSQLKQVLEDEFGLSAQECDQIIADFAANDPIGITERSSLWV